MLHGSHSLELYFSPHPYLPTQRQSAPKASILTNWTIQTSVQAVLPNHFVKLCIHVNGRLCWSFEKRHIPGFSQFLAFLPRNFPLVFQIYFVCHQYHGHIIGVFHPHRLNDTIMQMLHHAAYGPLTCSRMAGSSANEARLFMEYILRLEKEEEEEKKTSIWKIIKRVGTQQSHHNKAFARAKILVLGEKWTYTRLQYGTKGNNNNNNNNNSNNNKNNKNTSNNTLTALKSSWPYKQTSKQTSKPTNKQESKQRKQQQQ